LFLEKRKDAASLLKHPHDFTEPFLSAGARTIVSFPQSHTHLQRVTIVPFFATQLSARLITVNLAKRCPDKSVNLRLEFSARKQPHDWVSPSLSDVARTIVSFPQSHTHLQQTCRVPFFAT
jgi:hypothetical protein